LEVVSFQTYSPVGSSLFPNREGKQYSCHTVEKKN
jgi:hypothetical protein